MTRYLTPYIIQDLQKKLFLLVDLVKLEKQRYVAR